MPRIETRSPQDGNLSGSLDDMNCMGLSGSQSKNSGMHTTTAHMIQKLRRKALTHEQARPRTIQNDHGDQQKAMRAPGHLSPYI